MQDTLLLQAIQEGFITDDTIAIDATHFDLVTLVYNASRLAVDRLRRQLRENS